MPAAVWAILLLLSSTGCSATPTTRGLLKDDVVRQAIVNGTDAPKGRYRYIASLRSSFDGWMHFCGGVLIHPSAVLTAGHCVRNHFTGEDYDDDLHRPLVRLGGYRKSLDGPAEYEERLTKKTLVHPRFKTGFTGDLTLDFMTHDAAILILEQPSSMPVLRLPQYKAKSGSNPLRDWSPVTAMGWGWLDAEEEDSEALQQLAMSLVPLATCQADLGSVSFVMEGGVRRRVEYDFANNSLVCAARDYPNTFSGICGGDSGSPLVAKGSGGVSAGGSQDLLVGIASFASAKCGTVARKPSAFTDVADIMDWVAATLKQLPGTPASSPTKPGRRLVASVDATTAVGFTGKATQIKQRAGTTLKILTYPKWSLTATLRSGSTKGSVVLGQVVLRGPGTAVRVAISKGSAVVMVNGKALRAGGRQTIRGAAVRAATNKARTNRVFAIEQPGLAIRVIQPYSKRLKKLLPQLSVAITLTAPPAYQMGGVLGATLPRAAVAASAVAAVAGPLTASLVSGGGE